MAVTIFVWGLLALLGANMLVIQLLSAGDRAATASFYAREQLEAFVSENCGGTAPKMRAECDHEIELFRIV